MIGSSILLFRIYNFSEVLENLQKKLVLKVLPVGVKERFVVHQARDYFRNVRDLVVRIV